MDLHDPLHPDFEKTHRFGRLPLPRDDRDKLAREVRAAVALARKLWSQGGAAMRLDQGQTGTCEGNAWTNVLIAGPTTHPSYEAFADAVAAESWAQQVYVDATGDTTLQQGATTRSILRVLIARGLIAAYARCAAVEDVYQALQHGPVGFAMPWYYSMDRPVAQYGNYYLHADEASGIRGYHEVALTGIDPAPDSGPPWVRMENSWGRGWCADGTARIAFDDLAVLFLGDAFTISENPF